MPKKNRFEEALNIHFPSPQRWTYLVRLSLADPQLLADQIQYKVDLMAGRHVDLASIQVLADAIHEIDAVSIIVNLIVIIFIILSILFKDYSFLTSGNAYLSLIFLAPWSDKSPYLKKYMLIYGALIGVLGFIFMHFINQYYGMVLAITIINIIYIVIEKKLFKV